MRISNVATKIFSLQESKLKAKKAVQYLKNTTPFLNAQQPLEISTQICQEDSFFRVFLNKRGKVTLKEYEDIVKNHPRTLSKAYEYCSQYDDIIIKQDKIAKIALSLKSRYDELYDNYTIVSVGTSPAPITEVMQNLDCKVIYLPISELRFYSENTHHPLRHNYPTIASRHPNVEKLMKYASKKGIAQKEAGQLIVLDYIVSGKSLDVMTRILEERGDIPHGRIVGHSIIDDLRYVVNTKNPQNLSQGDVKNLAYDLRCSNMEKVSNIPHFTYDDGGHYGEQIFGNDRSFAQLVKDFDDFSLPAARAWALTSTHEAMKILKEQYNS